MFTKEEKLLWGEGPWVEEPDIVYFEYKGIPCLIDRKDHGALCGYIFIPIDHKYANEDEWEKLRVHGGVTWSGARTPSDTLPGGDLQGKTFFVIGFDCIHAMDYAPQFVYARKQINELYPEFKKIDDKYADVLKRLDYENPNNYKTIEFCIKELEQLVDQVLGEQNVLEVE